MKSTKEKKLQSETSEIQTLANEIFKGARILDHTPKEQTERRKQNSKALLKRAEKLLELAQAVDAEVDSDQLAAA